MVTIIFNQAGNFVIGNKAPLKKNKGKITKLEISPNPSGLSMMEPIPKPRLVTEINSKMMMAKVNINDKKLN